MFEVDPLMEAWTALLAARNILSCDVTASKIPSHSSHRTSRHRSGGAPHRPPFFGTGGVSTAPKSSPHGNVARSLRVREDPHTERAGYDGTAIPAARPSFWVVRW